MYCATKRRWATKLPSSVSGGIGFDTAMYLSQPGESTSQNIAGFCNEWGIDSSLQQAGGFESARHANPRSPRQIVMLQRKASKPGQGLGKTTGWIHRTTLLSRGVKMIPRRKLPEDRR